MAPYDPQRSGRPGEPGASLYSTVGSMLDTLASMHPTADAIVTTDGRLTFAELRAQSVRLAAGLAALDLGHGDKVAIWMPDRPSWYVVQAACARIGAIVVALDPHGTAHELGERLTQSDSRALVLADHVGRVDCFEVLHDVLPALIDAIPGELEFDAFPELRWVMVDADDEYPGCIRLRDVVDAGNDSLWSAADDTRHARAPRPDDVFTLTYASGAATAVTHRNALPLLPWAAMIGRP